MANKLRHASLINEQLRQEKQLRELDQLQQRKDDKVTHFPFTHGDMLEEQRKNFEAALKQELQDKQSQDEEKRDQ